jgi:hypothetical protein
MKILYIALIFFFLTGCGKQLVVDKVVSMSGFGGFIDNNNTLKVSLLNSNSTMTATSYSGNNEKFIKYSNSNFIFFAHYEDKDTSNSTETEKKDSSKDKNEEVKKPIDLVITKTFYDFSGGRLILNILGMIVGQVTPPAEVIQPNLLFLKDEDSNKKFISIIEYKLHNSEEINYVIKIENTGTQPLKEKFYVIDVVPSFFQVTGIEANRNSILDDNETIFVNSRQLDSNRTLLLFEINPPVNSGFEPEDRIFIKVTVKSDFNKLLYDNNLSN